MNRSDYRKGELTESDLIEDPVELFRRWIAAAEEAGITEPSAFCLSTISEGGQPSGRMLLLRGIDSGMLFYSNYLSRKGQELEFNPRASMTFWWSELERQVRIEGQVTKVSRDESDAYFLGRPEGSRQASAASPQSQVVASRQELERLVEAAGLERPEHWGGYRLVPSAFEFWQGRTSRLHDRFRYTKSNEQWKIERLAP